MANVTLAIVGDIAFSKPLDADPLGLVRQMGPELRQRLKADILLANLECILSDAITPDQQGAGVFPLHAPTSATQALKDLGVGAVSMATGHMVDYGPAGVESTLNALDAAGIAHFGAGTLAEFAEPCILERAGLRIGFVGLGGGQMPTRRRRGFVPLDSPLARRLIRHAKPRCDRLIVYFHEGIEATNYPMRCTVEACHRAVEAGADLVVGTHPHTVQGIEWYQGVPIAYSLGNFIMPLLEPAFYERWRVRTNLAEQGIAFPKERIAKELILRCTLDRDAVRVEAIPALMQESGIPRLPPPEEAAAEQVFFRRLCDAFQRPDDPVWRERDRIEQAYRRIQRSKIDWGFVVSRLHRLRWRHIAWYLKSLCGR
jgi:hypothetical protein